MQRKTLKKFESVVKPYGIVVVQGKSHYSVETLDGRRVGTLSYSGEINAVRQAIRDLVRQGLIDDKERRVTF